MNSIENSLRNFFYPYRIHWTLNDIIPKIILNFIVEGLKLSIYKFLIKTMTVRILYQL